MSPSGSLLCYCVYPSILKVINGTSDSNGQLLSSSINCCEYN